MKKNLLMVACLAMTMAACTNEEEQSSVKNDSRSALQVETSIWTGSRAMVEGTAFGAGAVIGVTLVENTDDAASYDGLTDGYFNVAYTSTGTGDTQTWGSDSPIMLSSTVGKAVAYYPYSADASDYKAIPVKADGQTDYMYSGWVTGISNAAPEASFEMNHALSAVTLVLKKGNYSKAANVSAISLASDGFGAAGTLNASTGALAGVTAAAVTSAMNPDFAATDMTAEGVSFPLMVVPTDAATANNMTASVTIDGVVYECACTMTEVFKQGNNYKFELTLDNTGLKVTKVSVVEWIENTTGQGGSLAPVI